MFLVHCGSRAEVLGGPRGGIAMACKQKTEVYSRVVGYYRPVQQWNKGKQAEYKDRIPFKVTGKAFANVGKVNKGEQRPEAAQTA